MSGTTTGRCKVGVIIIAAAFALALCATATGADDPELIDVSKQTSQIQEKIDKIYGVRTTQDGVLFVAHAPGAGRVLLAGDFNNWSPDATPMIPTESGETFRALLPLSPGRYRYRLVIDGTWYSDPFNNYVESNPFGDLNSVVEVG